VVSAVAVLAADSVVAALAEVALAAVGKRAAVANQFLPLTDLC
jgi:hypothetical protein